MKTKTIAITELGRVRIGDTITLRKQGVTVTGKNRRCISGRAHIELPSNPGSIQITVACTDKGWEFVGGNREIPAYEPGETGTATLSGVRVRGTWCEGAGGNQYFALHRNVVEGRRVDPSVLVQPDRITDFTPDITYSGISTEHAIRAMKDTHAARDNDLYHDELRELVGAVVNAIKKSDD